MPVNGQQGGVESAFQLLERLGTFGVEAPRTCTWTIPVASHWRLLHTHGAPLGGTVGRNDVEKPWRSQNDVVVLGGREPCTMEEGVSLLCRFENS